MAVQLSMSFESLEKKRYRESYISDDLDLDPPGSESSPGLSRRSTGSSGIEADARQHSISTEMTSMGEEGLQHREKCLSSATSQDSSSISESDVGSKGRREEQQDGGGICFFIKYLKRFSQNLLFLFVSVFALSHMLMFHNSQR